MEGETNVPIEKVEVKEVKKDLFLWKIESKKSKNGHSSSSSGNPSSSQAGEKGAENSNKGSSKEDSKENKSLVDGKIQTDD